MVGWPSDPANIDRTISVLQEIATRFTKPAESSAVVSSINLLNEPAGFAMSRETIVDFHRRGYQAVREINADIQIVLHDAFLPLDSWIETFDPAWTNVVLDTHIYHVFDVPHLNMSLDEHVKEIQQKGAEIARVNSRIPVVVGEW